MWSGISEANSTRNFNVKNFLIDIIYWQLLVHKVSEYDAMFLPTDSTISSLFLELVDQVHGHFDFSFPSKLWKMQINYLNLEYFDNSEEETKTQMQKQIVRLLIFHYVVFLLIRSFLWDLAPGTNRKWNEIVIFKVTHFGGQFHQIDLCRIGIADVIKTETYNSLKTIFSWYIDLLVLRYLQCKLLRERSNERKELCIVIVSLQFVHHKMWGSFILTLLAGIFMILLEIAHLNKWIAENHKSYI